ncbi:ornithine cyclodeaminase family protein [Acidianus sp. HS-5]|uniref:ornithine cyclodeaminase family protein n=1 Tax=Acidianus sp. HS-5 TaxID=2886040 RepID=UPI001F367CF6|nr:ornithine cyclodeaminase family protein [Acidianus sp. HS-5]BDC19564.1 ornithine cyclodeaminase [Acidianus sp. HS-5]
MALLLTEKDVVNLLKFEDAYNALKEAFIEWENKLGVNSKRMRTSISGSTLTCQAGGLQGYLGIKTFIKGNFVSLLFSTSGELLMIVEADRLSQIRTGTLAVLASDYIQLKYNTVGIIGLGKQGLAHVEAFYELKKIEPIVISRSQDRINKALRVLNSEGIKVKVAGSYKDVFLNSEVVTSVTSSKDPFIKLDYVRKGMHINLMGSNIPERVEAFPELIKASSIIVVEDIQQALEEAGDLILAHKMGMLDESKLIQLSSIISGKIEKKADDISIFKSTGIGLEDVAVMKILYEKAKKKGIGKEIEVKGTWSRE